MPIKHTFALIIMIFSVIFIPKALGETVDALSPITKLTVTSKLFKGPIVFNVTLPIDYDTDTDRSYSLFLDFHQRRQPMLTGLQDWLSHNGEQPWLKSLVVTPADWYEQIGQLRQAMNKTDQSSAMQDFMENELLPAIDKKYRTNGFRILTDFTGTTTLHTLFTRPNLFNAYIAVSPALASNDGQLLKMANKQLKMLTDKPRFLFVSTGNDRFERGNLAAFDRFSKLLGTQAPKQLRSQVKRFDGLQFMSQSPLATIYAVEMIFYDITHPLKPDSAIARQGAKAVVKHFRYLSAQQYGFEVSAEESLIELGLSQQKTSPTDALATLHLTIENYATSPHGYNALASIYAQQKQWGKAVKYQTEASQKAEHPYFKAKFTKTLTQYQNSLSH
jgi:hypothetical protein